MIFVILLKYTLDISTIFDLFFDMKTFRYASLFFLFFIVLANVVYSQQLDSVKTTDTLSHRDSALPKKVIFKATKKIITAKADTSRKDSSLTMSAIKTDTLTAKKDTVVKVSQPLVKSGWAIIDSLLLTNKFINAKDKAAYFIAAKKKISGKEFVFYSLCMVVLILGLFKTFYSSYFNNLFRVFLNTSIRQTQLTDQLLQAKFPSFILNIFFNISAGFYIWLLFKHYNPPRLVNNQWLLPCCILSVSALYFIKFCILKFMGWMSEMQQAADNYIFVIFLVNKIAGIILVPFIILLAFAIPVWVNYLTTFSLLLCGIFFLIRYIKTYGILEYKFPLSHLHFVLYITGAEIVPLLFIYKLVADYII